MKLCKCCGMEKDRNEFRGDLCFDCAGINGFSKNKLNNKYDKVLDLDIYPTKRIIKHNIMPENKPIKILCTKILEKI